MSTITYKPPPILRAFIKHYRPGELFYDWVVGPVGPLSGDSEFLTPEGWKRMDAYAPGDLVAQWEPEGEALSFVAPSRYIVGEAETLIHFKNKHSLSMVLSDNHRLVYYDARGELAEAPAGHVARHRSKRRVPTTFVPSGTRGTGMPEAVLRLAVAIHADGHFPATSPGSTARDTSCHIVLRKARKKERIRQLLSEAGIEWREAVYDQRPTETIFRFQSPYVGKRFEGSWWRATAVELEVILAEVKHWDGLFEGADTRYTSTAKGDADFIQYAAHACGGRATISTYNDPRNSGWAMVYTVHISPEGSRKSTVHIRESTQTTRVPAVNGKQYCFGTPTTYFLARHNGCVFVTGNSGKTTSIFMKLVTMAKLQERSSDGIRRTRAVVVRNTAPQLRDTTLVSWNYWFKDGQAGDWRATDKIFNMRWDDVECEVLFRPLDTAQDIARVLSLEVTFAVLDEFVQIPKEIIDALSARCGRYRPPSAAPPTNWGMWGASNPSTEDNWWFDYLHDATRVRRHRTFESEEVQEFHDATAGQDINATYYHQPGGLEADAENLDNLPPYDGSNKYYINQAKGKSDAWKKQFIDAEWGFSVSGRPVAQSFRPEQHVAKGSLIYNPHRRLIIGLDPGLAGTVFTFCQEDAHGRLLVLGELLLVGVGIERALRDHVKPYIRHRFPDAQVLVVPDPAANNRSQSDERSVVDVIKKVYDVAIESNNRLPMRLNAIDYFCTTSTDLGPRLQIDGKECPRLVRALKGGWRFDLSTPKSTERGEPEKNEWSHHGDSFGYACRYFHKQTARELRGMASSGKVFTPPRTFGAPYHFT